MTKIKMEWEVDIVAPHHPPFKALTLKTLELVELSKVQVLTGAASKLRATTTTTEESALIL
jgi:hypothetical protein